MDDHKQQRIFLATVWLIVLIALIGMSIHYENLAEEYDDKADEAGINAGSWMPSQWQSDEQKYWYEKRSEYQDLRDESEDKQWNYILGYGLWLSIVPFLFFFLDDWLAELRRIGKWKGIK